MSTVPLEELLRLRDRINPKLYEKVVFRPEPPNTSASHLKPAKPMKNRLFHRENKNRPREMSSKTMSRPVLFEEMGGGAKKKLDPRFDERCGEFNAHIHSENYAFMADVRAREKKVGWM